MKDINWSFLVEKLLGTLMLSQSELARLCRVSQQSVSNWKNGKREPEIYAKRKLLEIFQENSLTLYPLSAHEDIAEYKTGDNAALDKSEQAPAYADVAVAEFFDIYEKLPSSKKRELIEITKRKKAEEELKKSEQRYRLLAETSCDIISRLSIDSLKYLYVSPACKALLGYSQEEMNGRSFYDFLHPNDYKAVQLYHKTLPFPSDPTVACRMRKKNGQYLWVETTSSSVKIKKSSVIREVVTVTRDISKRKEIENTLKTSEERFKLLAENSKDVIMILATDGSILYISPSCQKLLGFKPEELLGNNFKTCIHPALHSRLEPLLAKTATRGFFPNWECRMKKKNNSYIWTQINIRHIKDFMPPSSNVFICVARDDTRHRKIEENVEYSEELLRTSSEASSTLLAWKTDKALIGALRETGQAMNVDRVYIFKDTVVSGTKKHCFKKYYEWESHTAKSIIGNTSSKQKKDSENSSFDVWREKLCAKKPVKAPAVRLSPNEKLFLESRNIESILLEPIFVEKDFWGFIGVDDCCKKRRWTESETSVWLTLANSFGASIYRSNIESKLEESKASFHIIADATPVMMWMADANMQIEYTNKSCRDFTGKKIENGKNKTWSSFLHPEDKARAGQIFEASHKKRKKFKIEYRARRKNGEYRWLIDYGTPRFMKDGTFAGFIGACLDITERKKIEGMLELNEEELHLALDATSTGAWNCDLETGSICLGEKATGLLDFFPEEKNLKISEVKKLVHPDDYSSLKKRLKNFLKPLARTSTCELRLKTESGAWKWMRAKGRIVAHYSNGMPQRIVGIIHDISEEKETEKNLWESEIRYKELFNSINSGIAVYKPTKNFTSFVVKDINKTGLKILKKTAKKEMLGKTLTQIFPVLKDSAIINALRLVARNGKTTKLIPYEYPTPEGILWIASTLYRLPSGDVVSVFNDITKQINNETELNKSENKYKALLKQTNDAIFITDAETGDVIECNTNARKMLKATTANSQSPLKLNYLRLHPAKDAKIIKNAISKLKKVGHISNIKCHLQPLESKTPPIPVELSGNAIDAEGHKLLLITMRDMTIRKKVETLREDIEHLIRHNLKAPLDFIIDTPGLLKKSIKGLTSEQAKMLQMLEDSGRKMLNTINLPLDIYRMENGTLTLRKEPIDILALLNSIQHDLNMLFEAKSVGLDIQINGKAATPEDKFILKADNFLCYSMLTNLIKNALETTPKGKSINIYLNNKKMCEITVHNMGTAPKEQKNAFWERHHEDGQLGAACLGVYSAKLIAETHGGQIKMTSSDKAGTSITVKLP